MLGKIWCEGSSSCFYLQNRCHHGESTSWKVLTSDWASVASRYSSTESVAAATGTGTGRKGGSPSFSIAVADGVGPVSLMMGACGTNGNISWRNSSGTRVRTGAEEGRGGRKSEGVSMERVELSGEECDLERIPEDREGGKMSRMIRPTEDLLRRNGGGRGVVWGEEVAGRKEVKLRP